MRHMQFADDRLIFFLTGTLRHEVLLALKLRDFTAHLGGKTQPPRGCGHTGCKGFAKLLKWSGLPLGQLPRTRYRTVIRLHLLRLGREVIWVALDTLPVTTEWDNKHFSEAPVPTRNIQVERG